VCPTWRLSSAITYDVCSAVVPTTCPSSSTSYARPTGTPDAGGPFACLGQPLPSTAPPSITISGIVTTAIGNAPVSGATLQGYVVGTTSPVITLTTDGNGMASASAPTGGKPIDGYFRASISGKEDTWFYPAVPFAGDQTIGVVMLTSSDVATVAQIANTSQDPTQAMMFIKVVDCNGAPLAGATISTQPAGTIRYFSGGTPNSGATATDSSGAAAVFDVPSGTVTLGAVEGAMTLRSHSMNVTGGTVLETLIQP
jgi:hypothetical protein